MKYMNNNNEISSSALANATKWTVIGEAFSKIISPITTMILARLLAAEVFGIIASITIITSLADLLTDAGFNAYIVQHLFKNKKEQKETVDVCFWSNFGISVLFFLGIVIFREYFAALVGAAGYEAPLVVASLTLPLTSFSSIEYALMQKEFKFKKLSVIKMICKLIPLVITVPLALLGFEYWSLIIGTLAGEIVNCIVSYKMGGYKPSLFYRVSILKKIFTFSSWAYLESILEWLLGNIAFPIVSLIYGVSCLGVFKTGFNMSLQIITAVYSLYARVYKSAIAKVQKKEYEFRETFLTFQKYASLLSFPLGVFVFLYRDLVTMILLGKSWSLATDIVGYYALTACVSISIGNFYSDSIRAKGKPQYLAIIDFVYLIAMGILFAFAKNMSFQHFCISFSLLKIVQPVMQTIAGQFICKVKLWDVLKNMKYQVIITVALCMLVVVFDLNKLGYAEQMISAVVCGVVYLILMCLFLPERKAIVATIKSKI